MKMKTAIVEIERKLLRLLHGHETRIRLREIHCHFLRHGLRHSNLLLAHFVSICGSLNKMGYANLIFHRTQNPNILLFNSMIKGYSLNGPYQESLTLFSAMKSRGIWPDEYTFAPLLKASSCVCDSRLGQCVHGEIIRTGFQNFASIRVGVVEIYTKIGKMDDAKKVFDGMPEREVVIWNLMIRGYCDQGDIDAGLKYFEEMPERSVVSWNSMISSLAQSGRDNEALGLFCEMRDGDLKLDEVTLITILPVCARLGARDVGQWIHSYSESKRLFNNFISVGNALVDFYCKCGDVETATRVFNEMPQKNTISWNSMISGLAFNGMGQLGVKFFEDMVKNGVDPNDTTFIGVLACCTHSGLVEKGREIFNSMNECYNMKPRLEHYGTMVDLLARSGRMREAYDLIQKLPMDPDAALWGSLLSACRVHGDSELAQLAAKALICLEPWNSGNYVSLSNIYAEKGRWDDVEKVRMLMKEKSVKKTIGQSAVS